jgi:hypothetical protein
MKSTRVYSRDSDHDVFAHLRNLRFVYLSQNLFSRFFKNETLDDLPNIKIFANVNLSSGACLIIKSSFMVRKVREMFGTEFFDYIGIVRLNSSITLNDLFRIRMLVYSRSESKQDSTKFVQ